MYFMISHLHASWFHHRWFEAWLVCKAWRKGWGKQSYWLVILLCHLCLWVWVCLLGISYIGDITSHHIKACMIFLVYWTYWALFLYIFLKKKIMLFLLVYQLLIVTFRAEMMKNQKRKVKMKMKMTCKKKKKRNQATTMIIIRWILD